MPEAVVPFLPQPANFRRICAWCRCDLGPLENPIERHSYGICEPCQQRYFAHLYEVEEDVVEQKSVEVLQERAIGE